MSTSTERQNVSRHPYRAGRFPNYCFAAVNDDYCKRPPHDSVHVAEPPSDMVRREDVTRLLDEIYRLCDVESGPFWLDRAAGALDACAAIRRLIRLRGAASL